LSAIALASDTGGDVDRLAIGQRHDCLLDVRARVGATLPALGLALLVDRVDPGHVDAEQGFHRRLDLRLGGLAGDLEHDRIVLGEQGRLLGDVRAQDDVIVADVDRARLLFRLSH
jgi:hypothetical protein